PRGARIGGPAGGARPVRRSGGGPVQAREIRRGPDRSGPLDGRRSEERESAGAQSQHARGGEALGALRFRAERTSLRPGIRLSAPARKTERRRPDAAGAPATTGGEDAGGPRRALGRSAGYARDADDGQSTPGREWGVVEPIDS